MNQLAIVDQHDLQIGDRLIRKKGPFSKHHGIYGGFYNGVPAVAHNLSGEGVQWVSLTDFLLGENSNLVRIEKFKGTEEARNQIVPRINELVGKKYDLINFNCEHFAEFIQTGVAASKQVAFAVLAVVAVGIGVLAFGNNNKRKR